MPILSLFAGELEHGTAVDLWNTGCDLDGYAGDHE